MSSKEKLIINHTIDEEDNTTLILSGDLDVQTAPQLKRFIDSLIKDGSENLKVDLSQLSYLDSSGFGVLVNAKRLTDDTRCSFNLSNMPVWMTEFFDLSILER